MVKYENNNGGLNINAPSYLCSTAEFEATTEVPDGSVLMVIDESSHTVNKYCIAYNGYWNEL